MGQISLSCREERTETRRDRSMDHKLSCILCRERSIRGSRGTSGHDYKSLDVFSLGSFLRQSSLVISPDVVNSSMRTCVTRTHRSTFASRGSDSTAEESTRDECSSRDEYSHPSPALPTTTATTTWRRELESTPANAFFFRQQRQRQLAQ